MNYSKSNKYQAVPLKVVSPIHRAGRQMALYLGNALSNFDLPGPHLHMLAYLDSYGPCRVVEITRVFGHKKPTVTAMLDRLEEGKYITRRPNPDDRRSFLVGATSKGKATGRRARVVVEAFDQDVWKSVSKGDLAAFHRVLDALSEITRIDVRSENNR